MLRRIATAGLMAVVVLCSLGASAAAAGPRLLLTKFEAGSEAGADLLIVRPGHPGQRTLLPGRPSLRRGLDGGASWSPDGRSVVFPSKRYLWLVGADGRGARRIPGTHGGYDPVFSPDGRTLAFARSRKSRLREPIFGTSAIWTVDLETGRQRRLTALRDELEQFPTSFSPDGSTLLATRLSGGRSFDVELVAIRFDGRTSSLLVGSGGFAEYSPDGSRIAFMRYRRDWDVYTVDSRGEHLRRLTNTPGVEEVEPSWDPSGRRIVYTRATFDRRGGIATASPWQMNRDGSCARQVISEPGYWLFAPSFQPGTGSDAGPLSC